MNYDTQKRLEKWMLNARHLEGKLGKLNYTNFAYLITVDIVMVIVGLGLLLIGSRYRVHF